MVIGIAMLSKPIWSIFYGTSELELGGLVLAVSIFGALFYNIYMITSSTLQSLNKFKAVYFTTLLGYIANAVLDVPFMLFFNWIGVEPFVGAIIASITGYTLSYGTALFIIKKCVASVNVRLQSLKQKCKLLPCGSGIPGPDGNTRNNSVRLEKFIIPGFA